MPNAIVCSSQSTGHARPAKPRLPRSLNRRFGGNVLHMDDFFLRPEQRTPERFAATRRQRGP
ncbi:MAG: hypothetical protein V9G11_04515 [Bifidobacterium adolescentis]